MMTIPDISFIIPVYNVNFSTLCDAIDSIANSVTHNTNFEIIIVVDGKDQVPDAEKLSHYNAHISVIRIEHGGVSKSRNIGIKVARGNWLAFVDADDCLIPNGIQNLWQGVIKTNCDLVVGNHIRRYKSKNVKVTNYKASRIVSAHAAMVSQILRPESDSGTVWGKLFRRSTVLRMTHWFDSALSNGEDIDFILRYTQLCETVLELDVFAYIYVFNTNSAVRSADKEYLHKMLTTINTVENDLTLIHENNPDVYERIFATFVLDRLLCCLRNYVFNGGSGSKYRYTALLNSPYFNSVNYAKAQLNEFSISKKIILYLIRFHCYHIVYIIYRLQEIAIR